MPLTAWNIYEITNESSPIHNVMLRGRIRKFSIERGFDCLVENASDAENVVRFALPEGEDAKEVEK